MLWLTFCIKNQISLSRGKHSAVLWWKYALQKVNQWQHNSCWGSMCRFQKNYLVSFVDSKESSLRPLVKSYCNSWFWWCLNALHLNNLSQIRQNRRQDIKVFAIYLFNFIQINTETMNMFPRTTHVQHKHWQTVSALIFIHDRVLVADYKTCEIFTHTPQIFKGPVCVL